MGKSKGGSSGGKAPVAPTNPGFNLYNASVFQPLGTYGAENLQGLGSLSNWASNIATGGNVQTGGTMPFNGLLPGGGTQFFAPFTSAGTTGVGGRNLGALAGVNSQQLGPFLSQAVGDLLQAQGSTGYLPALLTQLKRQYGQEGTQAKGFQAQGTDQLNYGDTLLAEGQGLIQQGQGLLTQATTGTGLFPTQQAMIDQSVKTQQAQITQQLSSEGLQNSTLMASLLGQASTAGAAAAGQLVQGNIQLAQAQIGLGQEEQKVGITEQGVGLTSEQLSQTEQQLMQDTQRLSLTAQTALFTQFSTISQLSSGLQAQMYQQAMEGYGAMGQMYNNVLNSFGYGLKTTEDVQQSEEFNAGLQLNEQQLQANASAAESQGFSNMLGGLGQLLGGGGGSGGLLGGAIGGGSGGLLGGLFGTSAAGASGALTGGVGGTIADIIGIVLGAIGGF